MGFFFHPGCVGWKEPRSVQAVEQQMELQTAHLGLHPAAAPAPSFGVLSQQEPPSATTAGNARPGTVGFGAGNWEVENRVLKRGDICSQDL